MASSLGVRLLRRDNCRPFLGLLERTGVKEKLVARNQAVFEGHQDGRRQGPQGAGFACLARTPSVPLDT